jgi:predicted metalloprotease
VSSPRVSQPVTASPEEERLKEFVSVVLADTEDTWRDIFAARGGQYEEPTLVLFRDSVQSACGLAGAAVGPFYCPGDAKVYLDLGFFEELAHRFGAPGDFAQAYVVAHEVGHHVQNLLGIASQVHEVRQGLGDNEANRLSVMMELQADCFAGVWANHADATGRNLSLEPGDVEEGLNAATRIGDDTLMRRSQGYVVPDAFTHGSGEQRVRWFRRGLDEGNMQACDTFNAERL